jgi:hypothetical protein
VFIYADTIILMERVMITLIQKLKSNAYGTFNGILDNVTQIV